jgi:hypothetical protein
MCTARRVRIGATYLHTNMADSDSEATIADYAEVRDCRYTVTGIDETLETIAAHDQCDKTATELLELNKRGLPGITTTSTLTQGWDVIIDEKAYSCIHCQRRFATLGIRDKHQVRCRFKREARTPVLP